MKKIIYTIIFAVFFLYACEDAYNIEPNDEILDENAFKTIADLEKGLNGVYAGISGSNVIGYSSRFTDDLRLSPQNRGQGVQVHTWSITTGTNEAASLWANMYSVINNSNRLLDKIDGVEAINESEEAIKKQIKGECYAVRAFEHFELLRLFAQDFEANTIGIPIIDKVVVFEQPVRNSVSEVVTFIKSDLDLAYSLLDDSVTDNSKFTKNAIDALRARLALYNKEYDDAILYSTKVIDAVPLASTADFGDVWLDNSDAEVIFKLARTTGDYAVGTLFTDTNGDVFFNMSDSLINHFNDNGWTDDIRIFTTLDVDNYDVDNLMVGKYLGNDANFGLNDIKIFRTGEQYLIRAEAYASKNSPDLILAAADIETLKSTRSLIGPVSVSFPTKEIAINKILDERRLELAYEGHRYFDLKRLNRDVFRENRDCELAAGSCILESGDYRFTLPIPQSEIFANENMIQNNGY